MDAALFASALALGLAGSPHCVAMCAAPCSAVTGGRRPDALAFHVTRLLGYAAAGALAAASVNALGALASLSPVFKPLWSLVHAGALGLGLWLAFTGRQPAWLERIGRRPAPAVSAGGWQVVKGPGKAAMAGAAWVAWPCGLLQSAVLVAALANGPVAGAGVMAAFAVASGVGLSAAPWLWRRLSGGAGVLTATTGVRLAGALLAAASAAAMGHGLWTQIVAYCTT